MNDANLKSDLHTPHIRLPPQKKNRNLRLHIRPDMSLANDYVRYFAACFREEGFEVVPFDRSLAYLLGMDVVILHWPEEFFCSGGPASVFQLTRKLAFMQLAKIFRRQKLIWIAHDPVPHDREVDRPIILQIFLRQLSGIVFLSSINRDIIYKLYPLTRAIPHLITRIGEYSSSAVSSPTMRPISGRVDVIFFGRLLPYKNADLLVKCFKKLPPRPETFLKVVGFYPEPGLLSELKSLTANTPIKLVIDNEPLPLAEIEQHVDAASCAVFPFRKILNSSTVIFALSRFRPVLAPRTGSLPELQADIGSDWLHLYDGELTEQILETFIEFVRNTPPSHPPDLSKYQWSKIGVELRDFVGSLF
jgi:beta-1,4-mannosyltransferase